MHCANSRKAWRCIQVKHQICQCSNFCNGDYTGNFAASPFNHSQFFSINQIFQTNEANRQSTYYVFLCNETCYCCRCQLPAEYTNNRNQQICKRSGDRSQDGTICCFCHLKTPVESLHNLNSCITKQNNGSSFYNVRPTTRTHCFKCKNKGRRFIFRQFHNEK